MNWTLVEVEFPVPPKGYAAPLLEPHAPDALVRSPPVEACTQSPEVSDETYTFVEDAVAADISPVEEAPPLNCCSPVHVFPCVRSIAQFDTVAEPLNDVPVRVAPSLEREWPTEPAEPPMFIVEVETGTRPLVPLE